MKTKNRLDEPIHWTLAEWPTQTPEEDLLVFLGEAERARWAEMRFEKRRKEWLLGRVTAKNLITSLHPSAEWQSTEIKNEPEGAPYAVLQGERLAGCLSISHRDTLAAATWTECAAVGIDLELIEPRSDGFVEDFFTVREREFVQALPASERALWVACVWSAKESVLKVLRKGLRLDTRQVEVLPASGSNAGPDGWQPLTIRCALLPETRVYWQPRGDFMLTLAIGGTAVDPLPRLTEIILNR